jgi:hypothetical protein
MRNPMTLLIIMALSLVATSVAAQTHIFPNCIRGNVDDDAFVTLQDITKIEKYILGVRTLSCHQVMHADANRDWRVDEQDIESLLSDLGRPPSEYTWGDFDGNGVADEYDFLLLREYVSGQGSLLQGELLETGDISGDGLVNQLDIDIFLECESGKLTSPFSQGSTF